ncbi:NAD-dependent succinate-semialdehyde dehydrogenase [Aeromicrobium terrae]|uniref:NAD-dependent succinate-semialdehyde dehydrogenase n=1 Tax=Aeromicrobium terrae TaxID=2498846 RepID=A0A5C8NJV2_9ACTN|nr:NAD-dependent succinate-semialdehyde dehydrogenase [Aeromicrobium terrae]TXL61317.1 NAD-dependent succinate-semialdehyde dehydrogenase [Aeromicrobium terrae]
MSTDLAVGPTGSFVDGEWVEAGEHFAVLDPSTGGVLAEVADVGPEVARAAMDAAARAQAGWAATSPRERAAVLRAVHDRLLERTESLATLMSLEMGKPLAEARGEVAYGAEFFLWFAEEAVRLHGSFGPSPSGASRIVTSRRPVGPVLAITPWNFPLAMAARKVAPALAAGCTVVLKPAELAPLTSLELAGLLAEAGLPDGVLNVVTTTRPAEVTGPLLGDPRLRKLTFTGSTAVGRQLLADAAPRVLRTSMELGGNAPFVVLEDADVERAIDGAMIAKLRNVGQACTAANRFLVHESVADAFVDGLADRMAVSVVGAATDPATDVGPVISAPALEKIAGLVDDAVAHGARVVTGGRRLDGGGFYYAPTVVADVPETARIAAEEIFGPVAAVSTFATEEEAFQRADGTEFGLAAYVYSADLDRALRFAERLETGMVGVNQGVVSDPAAPFGGMKASGLGREGGPTGIDEYLETQYVAVPRARP